jgi:hypothetical protein
MQHKLEATSREDSRAIALLARYKKPILIAAVIVGVTAYGTASAVCGVNCPPKYKWSVAGYCRPC